jgi:Tfp pilus assembly protein PilN
MMQAVDLDYLADKRPNWIGLMVLAIGAIALVLMVGHYRDLNRKISDQELLVSRLQAQNKNSFASPASENRSDEQIARETKRANAAILQLSLPWRDLFEALEATRKNDVAILAIEPDVKKGLVNISAEAKKLDSMLDYAASLQKVALFREVLILNHQVQEQDTEKPIRFVVQAAWELQH